MAESALDRVHGEAHEARISHAMHGAVHETHVKTHLPRGGTARHWKRRFRFPVISRTVPPVRGVGNANRQRAGILRCDKHRMLRQGTRCLLFSSHSGARARCAACAGPELVRRFGKARGMGAWFRNPPVALRRPHARWRGGFEASHTVPKAPGIPSGRVALPVRTRLYPFWAEMARAVAFPPLFKPFVLPQIRSRIDRYNRGMRITERQPGEPDGTPEWSVQRAQSASLLVSIPLYPHVSLNRQVWTR